MDDNFDGDENELDIKDIDFSYLMEGIKIFAETLKNFDAQQCVKNFSEGLDQMYKNLEIIKQLNFDVIYQNINAILNALANLTFDDMMSDTYLSLFESKWFPYLLKQMTNSSFVKLEEAKNSEYSAETIDEFIFKYYDFEKIKFIENNWSKNNLSEYSTRVLNESVDAYFREEYAITVVMMSMMWEGIIYNKLSYPSKRTTKATKENYTKLIQENGIPEMVLEFFDKYVFYNCNNETDVIDDVPGRHASAHSFNISYPSKKCALNAILVTDFLLSIQTNEAISDNNNKQFSD